MVVEYEVWRIEGGKVTKFATRDGRQEALDLVDKYAPQEPGVLWEVYEVTSERIHYVEIQKPKQ